MWRLEHLCVKSSSDGASKCTSGDNNDICGVDELRATVLGAIEMEIYGFSHFR